jgi:hypothetical protein
MISPRSQIFVSGAFVWQPSRCVVPHGCEEESAEVCALHEKESEDALQKMSGMTSPPKP